MENTCVKQDSKAYVFWGRHAVMSNFSPSKFKLENIVFTCAEQYLWFKAAEMFNDEDSANKILESKDPAEQKGLSRNIKNFDVSVWDGAKEKIIEKALRAKFGQNEHLNEKLQATRGKSIGEATRRDTVWGIGMNLGHKDVLDCSKWSGNNLLGKVLTRVRDS